MIISNQPFFYKKAELFPGSAFVIGADTAARLVNVRIQDFMRHVSSVPIGRHILDTHTSTQVDIFS